MKCVALHPGDSLSEALRTVREGTCIVLSPGVYREKIEIAVPNVTIVGESPETTRIVWGDFAAKRDANGAEYTTFRSYTAAVLAPGVTLRGVTVENDARAPERKGQEIALSICADGFLAEDCRFLSTQDTLFCGPLPPDLIVRYYGVLKDSLRTGGRMLQIFRNCLIAGNVDFIFGCGNALFEGCEIRSVYDVRGQGFVAAPAHHYEQKTGFVFHKCRFTREATVRDGTVYLARPWRDHGKSSFICCEYGRHIAREGFDSWEDSGRDKTARFAEYGAIPAGRVAWSSRMTEAEKEQLLRTFR